MGAGTIESLLNDLAALLMLTTSLEDVASRTMAEEQLDAILEAAKDLPKLLEAARAVRATLASPGGLEALQRFVTSAQQFLVRPDETHFSVEPSAPSAQRAEITDDLDPQLLTEFIEKHTLALEELESTVLAFNIECSQAAVSDEARDTFRTQVKGNIHTMKGDAGSIGLMGIEHVCHVVEDYFLEHEADTCLDALIAFREWAGTYLSSLAQGERPSEDGATFLERFREQLTPQAAREEVANTALLAELEAADNAPATPSASHPAAGGATYQLEGERDVFQEFVLEAEDHLSSVESTVLDAGGHYSKDAVDSIFRSIHSIKGSSSYFGLREVKETSHSLESILDEVRDGKRLFDQPLTELVLQYLDVQRKLLSNAKAAASGSGALTAIPESSAYLVALARYVGGFPTNVGKGGPETAEPPAVTSASSAGVPQTTPTSTAPKGEEEGGKLDIKTYVKVDTKRLDELIDAIGEMSIYSSMLIQHCRRALPEDEAVQKSSHQVEKVARDLQNIGMSMRLIPIRGIFQKMSRLVWDLSKKTGKDVRFKMEGEDTELDRTIIDKLADPLMHMIRNSLDHGVEPPEERRAAGKPPQGQVTLAAFHASGSIHIRIEDDGRGLNPEKLMKKAVEKGILREGQQLSKEDAYNLIFAAGFSTAAVVTDISGRGVGMDVVKRNIESLRGRIRIRSEVGRGTSFTIELPLTLAIMDGIEVGVGTERFLIPTLSVIEFMRPQLEHINRTLDRGETYSFRGKFLPVYRLAELFGLSDAKTSPEGATFVVLESVGEQFVLMVDEILGSCSTVIKSLGKVFEGASGFSGCAIMANGEVSLILDVQSLLRVARERYSFAHRTGLPSRDGEPLH